jgi:hypothetical protein
LNINLILLLVQVGIIPTIFSLIKLYKGERFYLTFYIYIIASYITEVITNRMINAKNYEFANTLANSYFLLELILLILLIKKILGYKKINKILILPIIAFWVIENTLLHKIYQAEKYFNVLSAIILFGQVSYALVINLNKNYSSFFKEANIIIILTLLFNLFFRLLFEFLYSNYDGNIHVLESIANIYILVNFSTNILFIYCLSCIKNAKKLISSF